MEYENTTIPPDVSILDADYIPAGGEEWESPTKTADPYRYIHRCTMIRRRESRANLFVKRLLLGSIAFFLWAVALAALLG